MGCNSSVIPEQVQYEPFTDFPTPALLAQAQIEFTQAKIPLEKDDKGVPLPRPPPTTKRECFDSNKYKYIDDHAISAPYAVAETNYTNLVQYLIKPAKNETAKIRALFMWIGSQDLNKILRYLGNRLPPKDSPLFHVIAIMAKKRNGLYNAILNLMSEAAGIPCILEKSKVKGAGYRVGEVVGDPGNQFCIVFVDGSWRIIDQHWGSSSVSAVADAEWQVVQDGGGTQTSNHTQQTYYAVDEDWFLIDPVQFAYSHFCPTLEHQLLARPLTANEFNEIAYLDRGFFYFNMTSLSHPRCIVECDDGVVTFEFGGYKEKVKFFYNLYKSALDPSNDIFKGFNPKQFVFMQTGEDKVTVRIEFPWIGKYKLEMESMGLESGRKRHLAMCEYLIHCTKPKFGAKPNPDNSIDNWGLGADMVILGMAPLNHQGGFVQANQGTAELQFKLNNTSHEIAQFTPQLLEFKGSTTKVVSTKHVVRYYQTEENVITTAVKVRDHGKYVLSFKVKDEKKDLHTSNYLVEADEGCTEFISNFPETLGKTCRTGNVANKDDMKLIPVSHKVPIFNVTDGKQVCIEMKQNSSDDLRVQPTLLLYDDTEQEPQDVSEYLFHEKNGLVHRFCMKFAKIGNYALNLVSLKSAKSTPLYQYIISVKTPNTKALPYPDRHEGWKDGYKLIEPTEGALEESACVHFKYTVPGAKEVKLQGSKNTYNLNKVAGGTWEKEVNLDPGSDALNVVAVVGKNQEYLLTYQIMAQRQIDAQNEELEKADREAADKNRENEAKREIAKQEAERRKKEEDEEIEKQTANFEKNKEKYESRERELETKQFEKDAKEEEPDYTKITLDDEMKSEGLNDDISKAKKDAESGWKNYQGKVDNQVAMGRLKEAIATRQIDKLEKAIAVCEKKGIDEKEVKKARNILEVEVVKRDLLAAMGNKDIDEILEQLVKIEDSRLLMSNLQAYVIDARHLIEKMERISNLRAEVLDMDRKTMAEMRRYQNPSPVVHKVLMAALLLLGEDEESTEEWQYVQKQLNPTGKGSMNQRIVTFDPETVNPEIAARARQILNTMDLKELQRQSSGAATFYVWAMGVLEDPSIDPSAKPADIERQKEILNRLPARKTPPRSWEKFYNKNKTPRSTSQND